MATARRVQSRSNRMQQQAAQQQGLGRLCSPGVANFWVALLRLLHVLLPLRLLVLGRSNGEIAVALSLGTGTVRTHVANILQKLNAGDRTEAVSLALRRGIV